MMMMWTEIRMIQLPDRDLEDDVGMLTALVYDMRQKLEKKFGKEFADDDDVDRDQGDTAAERE